MAASRAWLLLRISPPSRKYPVGHPGALSANVHAEDIENAFKLKALYMIGVLGVVSYDLNATIDNLSGCVKRLCQAGAA